MDKEQLISYLEFVEKAIEFCEKNPIRMISIPNFISYLRLTSETKWLKGRLDKMHEYYEDIFKVNPVDYTTNKWTTLIKDIPLQDLPKALRQLKYIELSKIDFSKPITAEEIDSRYNAFPTDRNYCNEIIDKVSNEIKNDLVKEILSK
jgi:hypothetical protein